MLTSWIHSLPFQILPSRRGLRRVPPGHLPFTSFLQSLDIFHVNPGSSGGHTRKTGKAEVQGLVKPQQPFCNIPDNSPRQGLQAGGSVPLRTGCPKAASPLCRNLEAAPALMFPEPQGTYNASRVGEQQGRALPRSLRGPTLKWRPQPSRAAVTALRHCLGSLPRT